MPKKGEFKDITGKRSGKLVALECLGREGKYTQWLCQCDCGKTCKVTPGNMNGGQRSCGCTSGRNRERLKERGVMPRWVVLRRSHCKARARKKGLGFDLTVDDVWGLMESTPTCPLLGITLDYYGSDSGAGDLASLDRIDSNKGYTKDNVWIISRKANSAKNNLTLEELEMLVKNLSEALTNDSIQAERDRLQHELIEATL